MTRSQEVKKSRSQGARSSGVQEFRSCRTGAGLIFNARGSSEQGRRVKPQDGDQTETVIPGLIQIKASACCTVGQMHNFSRLIGVVHIKNQITVRLRSKMIDHQAVIYGFEMGDINCADASGVHFTSQPVCHTFLPGTWGGKNDSPVANSPIRWPPKTHISLQRLGVL